MVKDCDDNVNVAVPGADKDKHQQQQQKTGKDDKKASASPEGQHHPLLQKIEQKVGEPFKNFLNHHPRLPRFHHRNHGGQRQRSRSLSPTSSTTFITKSRQEQQQQQQQPKKTMIGEHNEDDDDSVDDKNKKFTYDEFRRSIISYSSSSSGTFGYGREELGEIDINDSMRSDLEGVLEQLFDHVKQDSELMKRVTDQLDLANNRTASSLSFIDDGYNNIYSDGYNDDNGEDDDNDDEK